MCSLHIICKQYLIVSARLFVCITCTGLFLISAYNNEWTSPPHQFKDVVFIWKAFHSNFSKGLDIQLKIIFTFNNMKNKVSNIITVDLFITQLYIRLDVLLKRRDITIFSSLELYIRNTVNFYHVY